jgi:ubiquinone/menaquinone biosynthesis C-methylase UbiE
MQKEASLHSIATRGRTLDHAAFIYDFFEPILLLGKQAEYDQKIVTLLDLTPDMRVLDVGCGTGVLTRAIGDWLDGGKGGAVIGIDAAAKMIQVARKKRQDDVCRFEVAAAENLPFEDQFFDAAVSSLFFHHVPLDLKKKSLKEIYRVLKLGKKLVVADMHIPTTIKGALISHAARWLLFQPQIGENIRGVLPHLIEAAGFSLPAIVKTYFGYISVFKTYKTEGITHDIY